MIRVSYERFEAGTHNTVGEWKLVRKDFSNVAEADLFIHRISNNIIVGNIWKTSI